MHLRSIWNKVVTVGPIGVFPDVEMHYMIRICQQCEDPACAKPCMTDAIYRRDDGLVAIDPDKCTSCEACIPACPYGVLFFNPDTGLPEKCHMCAHRIEQGLKPACVSPCVGQAIIFGDANDPQSEFSRTMNAAGDGAFVLEPESETRPAVRYIRAQNQTV